MTTKGTSPSHLKIFDQPGRLVEFLRLLFHDVTAVSPNTFRARLVDYLASLGIVGLPESSLVGIFAGLTRKKEIEKVGRGKVRSTYRLTPAGIEATGLTPSSLEPLESGEQTRAQFFNSKLRQGKKNIRAFLEKIAALRNDAGCVSREACAAALEDMLRKGLTPTEFATLGPQSYPAMMAKFTYRGQLVRCRNADHLGYLFTPKGEKAAGLKPADRAPVAAPAEAAAPSNGGSVLALIQPFIPLFKELRVTERTIAELGARREELRGKLAQAGVLELFEELSV